MPRAQCRIDVIPDTEFAQELEADLLNELREKSAQAVNSSFSLRLQNDEGETLGGLTASTSYGWLLIKVLFVSPSARRCGHGRALLDCAKEHARTSGCHSVWLDTSDENAYQFYQKMGFKEFGILSNGPSKSPTGHSRWFLKSEIAV